MELPSYPYTENGGQEVPFLFNDMRNNNNNNNDGIRNRAVKSVVDIESDQYPTVNSDLAYNDNENGPNLFTSIINDSTLSFFGVDVNSTYSTTSISANFLNSTTANATNPTFTGISRDELNQYLLFNIAYYMNRYYLWVVFALGFPGNIVSFVTILKMKPYTSPTMYIAGLALVDNTCLVCKLLFFLLTKYDVPLGDNGCGVLIFLGVFVAQLANWLLVAMTVERCLAICLPLKVGSICTKKVHILGLGLMVVCLAGINAQNFITNKMLNYKGDLYCDTNPAYQDFMKVWFWVDAMFYSFLPSALLIVMNTLLILGIRRSAKVQRELTSKACQAAEGMRQQRQITIMLVIVCITFVLLVTPNALFYAIKPNWDYKRSALEMARYNFTQQLIFVLCDSTHAVNFYLYFFSTRRFRTRCLETAFFCCLSKRRSRAFHYGATTNRAGGNCFRMSMTEVTNVPTGNSMPLRQYSSSSTSSASSMGRGGRHVILRNGAGVCKYNGGGVKTTFKVKDTRSHENNVVCKRYELV